MLQIFVHLVQVHFQITVNQYIPESSHRDQSPGKILGEDPDFTQHGENIGIVLGQRRIQVGDDLLPDVQCCLDRYLELVLGNVSRRCAEYEILVFDRLNLVQKRERRADLL